MTADNVNQITESFLETLASLGDSIHGLRGIPLLTALKREKLAHGPYPGVSLFEAANRIMSDLVILRGIAGLIRAGTFGIDSYLVEFGNEDHNGFDIRGKDHQGRTLVGEAFNVAPSFFGPKKQKAVSKLRSNGSAATYRLLLVNDDAVDTSYAPRAEPGFQYVFVNIESGAIRIVP
ncbi:hypothetical protein [Pandoraea anhela]|uniref:hypothetical protein n=1 Tax=Pandoraea anhela TaxID=2508295 RepID=UPI001C2D0B0C|nr:hypothetical protein [Pandoraea anhela]